MIQDSAQGKCHGREFLRVIHLGLRWRSMMMHVASAGSQGARSASRTMTVAKWTVESRPNPNRQRPYRVPPGPGLAAAASLPSLEQSYHPPLCELLPLALRRSHRPTCLALSPAAHAPLPSSSANPRTSCGMLMPRTRATPRAALCASPLWLTSTHTSRPPTLGLWLWGASAAGSRAAMRRHTRPSTRCTATVLLGTAPSPLRVPVAWRKPHWHWQRRRRRLPPMKARRLPGAAAARDLLLQQSSRGFLAAAAATPGHARGVRTSRSTLLPCASGAMEPVGLPCLSRARSSSLPTAAAAGWS